MHWSPPKQATDRVVAEAGNPNLNHYGSGAGLPDLVAALQHKLATENDIHNVGNSSFTHSNTASYTNTAASASLPCNLQCICTDHLPTTFLIMLPYMCSLFRYSTAYPARILLYLSSVLISQVCQFRLLQCEVMVTAGANQAFTNVVLTLLDTDDQVVLFKPYYFNHLMAVQMTGGGSNTIFGRYNSPLP